MLLSLAYVFMLGLILAYLCEKIKLPKLVGFLLTGIILGPYVLNALDPKVLSISPELRKIALIIILLKAGLSLDLKDLKQIGGPALRMSFLPASFEIIGWTLIGPHLFPISTLEACLIGSVLGAVSPAVVVPKMVVLMDGKWGTKKKIPQLILAGSSLDDVYVIVIFTTLMHILQGEKASVMSFVNIPVSIICGLVLGALVGHFLTKIFETFHTHNHTIRNSMKVIIILAISFFLVELEGMLQGILPMSGLLAVMSMGLFISKDSTEFVSNRLKDKFGKIWLAAEVILFVLVGAEVDITYAANAGWIVILGIFLALLFRSLGVYLALLGTNFNKKERLFTIFAYLPKATVQAAIGGIPLAVGLDCGMLVLTIAVVAILVTAPLGAFLIEQTHEKWLEQEV